MNGTKNNAKELDQGIQIDKASLMLLELLVGPCLAEDGGEVAVSGVAGQGIFSLASSRIA